MNESSQDHYMPIREIQVPDEEDNLTLPSELSTLLTHNNNNLGYDHHIAHGSSNRQPTHPTHPTGVSGDTQDTSVSKRAFQWAAILGLLSLCALLYADVIVNMNLAGDAALDQWDIESDAPSTRAELFDESNDIGEQQHKTSFWHKLRNTPAKTAKKLEKQKKAKTNKKTKSSKKDGDNKLDDHQINQVPDESDNDSDDDAGDEEDVDDNTMDDDNDEIIYPKTTLDQEPKLVPADVIAAATSVDESKHTKIYKPMDIPIAKKRCGYVIQTFEDQNVGVSHDFLKEKYISQSVDPNVFYRATALLFWKDFAAKQWGSDLNKSIDLEDLVLLDEAKYEDGTPLSPMSTWTWITGDQHLRLVRCSVLFI